MTIVKRYLVYGPIGCDAEGKPNQLEVVIDTLDRAEAEAKVGPNDYLSVTQFDFDDDNDPRLVAFRAANPNWTPEGS